MLCMLAMIACSGGLVPTELSQPDHAYTQKMSPRTCACNATTTDSYVTLNMHSYRPQTHPLFQVGSGAHTIHGLPQTQLHQATNWNMSVFCLRTILSHKILTSGFTSGSFSFSAEVSNRTTVICDCSIDDTDATPDINAGALPRSLRGSSTSKRRKSRGKSGTSHSSRIASLSTKRLQTVFRRSRAIRMKPTSPSISPHYLYTANDTLAGDTDDIQRRLFRIQEREKQLRSEYLLERGHAREDSSHRALEVFMRENSHVVPATFAGAGIMGACAMAMVGCMQAGYGPMGHQGGGNHTGIQPPYWCP